MSLDLHSRISMINKMNGYETPEPVAPTQQEIDAEEALVTATLATVTEEAPVTGAVLSATPPKDDTSEPEADKIDLVLEAINELKAEITKMNKHINSIQKFIKKNS